MQTHNECCVRSTKNSVRSTKNRTIFGELISNKCIDIKNLPNGIYLIYTKSELFEFKEKLIIY